MPDNRNRAAAPVTNGVVTGAAPYKFKKNMKSKYRYTALCVDMKQIVIDSRVVNRVTKLDNGYLIQVGDIDHFTPDIKQSNELSEAWKFAQQIYQQERFSSKQPCPDRL